jgi:hypothetical protein
MTDDKKFKKKLLEELDTLAKPDGGVLSFKRGDNHGPLLGQIFVWQEAKKYAESQLKKAWKTAADEGLIQDDAILREKNQGEEHVIIQSNSFTCMVTVDKPHQTFSKDKFVEAVAKRYKLDRAQLDRVAATCTTDSVAPLKKRIVEG